MMAMRAAFVIAWFNAVQAADLTPDLTACLDHDIGLQDTFWTGPGEGNWGRPAKCADYFAASQSDPLAFCTSKIGGSQTFAERFAKWSGKEEHATGLRPLDFSAFPQEESMWDYFCGASCAKLGVFADHCKQSPPSQPAPPVSPPPPPTPPAPPTSPQSPAAPPPLVPSPSLPPSPPNPPSPPKASEDGLGAGAIAGIAIGAVLLVGIGAAVTVRMMVNARKPIKPVLPQ